jgi:hypothetical protein
LSFQNPQELISVSSWAFQVSCPARSAGPVLRVTTPGGVAPGGPSRGLGMEVGLVCPPVLGMVARQFLGWSPILRQSAGPGEHEAWRCFPHWPPSTPEKVQGCCLGVVACHQFLGWSPASSRVGRPSYVKNAGALKVMPGTVAWSGPLRTPLKGYEAALFVNPWEGCPPVLGMVARLILGTLRHCTWTRQACKR